MQARDQGMPQPDMEPAGGTTDHCAFLQCASVYFSAIRCNGPAPADSIKPRIHRKLSKKRIPEGPRKIVKNRKKIQNRRFRRTLGKSSENHPREPQNRQKSSKYNFLRWNLP